MAIRPYAAGALPPGGDAEAVQLATALVDAGEGVLAVNAAGSVATAAAAREPTLLAAIAQPLSARSGRLLLALAGGYAEPGIPILGEPFDLVQATWCRSDRPASAGGIAALYDQGLPAPPRGEPGAGAGRAGMGRCRPGLCRDLQSGSAGGAPLA